MQTQLNPGDIVEAEITKITDFGAFAKINAQSIGLIHISQISHNFVKNINEHLKVGEKVKARIVKLGPGNKIDLTLRNKEEKPQKKQVNYFNSRMLRDNSGFKSSDFEEKLRRFL